MGQSAGGVRLVWAALGFAQAPKPETATMNTPLVSLAALCAAIALPAQTSLDYQVHHDFLPTGAAYANLGSTGVVNDGVVQVYAFA